MGGAILLAALAAAAAPCPAHPATQGQVRSSFVGDVDGDGTPDRSSSRWTPAPGLAARSTSSWFRAAGAVVVAAGALDGARLGRRSLSPRLGGLLRGGLLVGHRAALSAARWLLGQAPLASPA
jgi:hypothetical protein